MVVNNMVNVNANFAKNPFAAAKANAGGAKPTGNFDTFVDMMNKGIEDKNSAQTDKLKAQKFALDTARVSWSFECNYRQMKSICENAMKYEAEAQKKFKELQEEKAYYAELDEEISRYLKEDGKFALEELREGDILDRDKLQKAKESVQEKIDNLITGTEKYYERASYAYELSGTMLSQITGDVGKKYKSTLQPMLSQLPYDQGYNALDMKSVSAFAGVSRTEENFLDYSEDTLDDIKGKIESLDKLKEEYLQERGNIKPAYDNEQLSALLFQMDKMEKEREKLSTFGEY